MIGRTLAAYQGRVPMTFAALLLGALGAVAAVAAVALAGTKTGLALALGTTLGPALAYTAIVAPLAFPFTAFVALVPFDNVLNPDGTGTVTRLLAIASGLALLFYIVRTGRVVRPSGWLFTWVALYAWMASSAFWALDSAAVFALFPTAVQLLALYVSVSLFPADARALRWVVGTALIGGVLAAGYGAYLFTHGLDVGKGDRLWITTDTGNFVDPNHFAAALILPFALSLALTLYARKWWHALFGIAALIAVSEGIIVSASRGAIIGVAAILVYALVRSAHRIRLLLLGGLATVCAMLTQSSLSDRFAEALSSGGSGRTDIWQVGIAAAKSHWLIGAGYNNFAFAYDQAFLQATQVHFMSWHRAPHNILLNVVVELGIPGTLLLMAAWYGQLRMMRGIGPADPNFPLRLALEATIIGTFVAALFLDVMVMKYVWLTFALVAILRNVHLADRSTVHA